MQFLVPLFWIAAASIAVPIVLHLTRKAARKPIPFASLMFLRRIPMVEVRRRRLKHPLLLLLRCLGILLLVAAFSRPVVDRLWSAELVPGTRTSTVLLLDRSMSMSRSGVWEEARDALRDRIARMEAGDEAAIVQFGSKADTLTTWESSRDRLLELAENRVELSFETTAYGEGFRVAVDLLDEARNLRREIVLITDLQLSALNPAALSEIEIPQGAELKVVDVGTEVSNRYIEDVRLQKEVFGETYPYPIVARLGSHIPDSAGLAQIEGEIQLQLEDRLVDRRSFRFDQSGSASVSFKPFSVPSGRTRGRLVLSPADSLEADDIYNFVLERKSPARILVVSPPPQDDVLYFQRALESGRNLAFTTRLDSELRSVQSEETPLIVINNLPRIPTSGLREFINAGGGVIVCLGNAVDPEAYNQQLGDLLPARLAAKRFASSAGSPFVSISETAGQHPVFFPFQQTRENALSGVQFYGYWEVEANAGSQVLARFSSGSPALVESALGEGKILLFASSLGRVWSDFPLRSAYLPFWQEMVSYAAGWKADSAAMTVGQVLSLKDRDAGAAGENGSRWDLLDPRGRRVLALDQETPDFVPLTQPGFYELRADRESDWLAVNPDSSESQIARADLAEFTSALKVSLEKPAREPLVDSPETDTQYGVWWLILIAALLVLLAEAVVSNRIASRGGQSLSEQRI